MTFRARSAAPPGTALMFAVMSNHVEAARELVRGGAQVTAKDAMGRSVRGIRP